MKARVRRPVEQRQTMDHRIAARLLAELLEKREALTLQIHRAVSAEAQHRLELSTRLGVTVPFDPTGVLYDILARVEAMPDGGWRWLGITNNKNLPTVRLPGGAERSAVRYLATAFGVLAEDDPGVLYPTVRHAARGYIDVNPYHRVVRHHAVKPSNPARHGQGRAA